MATKTVLEIITQAMHKAGILGFGDTAEAEEIAVAHFEFEAMIRGWRNKSSVFWNFSTMELALTDNFDVPNEWWDAVIYSLAARLSETNPSTRSAMVAARAEELLREALAYERDASVFFIGEWYNGQWVS